MIDNVFVNSIIESKGMPKPDIPARLRPSYSQCYEDIIVESLFLAYLRKTGTKNKKFIGIEIGANHPVCTSSTYLFSEKYGMRSVLVEANPKLIPALLTHRKNDIIIPAAVTDKDISEIDFYVSQHNETSSLDVKFVQVRTPGIKEVIKIPTIRANQVFEVASQHGNEFLLTVDVEAYDLPILRDIDWQKYRPLTVNVEPSEDYQPGSIRGIMSFMEQQNYSVIAETAVNLIFKDNTKM